MRWYLDQYVDMSAGSSSISVLLVDDHALVREGIGQILDHEPDISVVGEADSGEAALDLLKRMQPDVVLLDVRMPGIGGIETARKIRSAFPDIRVLMLSAYAEFILEALRAGASGYLLKTAGSRQLVAGVRSVFLGSTVVHGDLGPTLGVGSPSPGSRSGDVLSRREAEILSLIARGLTNRAIARMVGIAPRTADQHAHNILVKLGARSRAEAIRYAIEHELVSATSDSES
jgi:two-component system, NarL family, response regulator LiaR